MFTGIVHTMGRVLAADRNDFGLRLTVDPQPADAPADWPFVTAAGDSVAVDGCCLTQAPAAAITGEQTAQTSPAATPAPDLLAFDVIQETLAKTTLGDLCPGDRVNLEPAMRADTPLGGHFVQGHIDGVGVITEVQAGDDEWRVTIRPPATMAPYLIAKGSITVDGVSLTVARVHSGDVGEPTFTVALIPTTLRLTKLGAAAVGQRVNLESDILTRTVVDTLQLHQAPANVAPQADPRASPAETSGVTLAGLQRAGFI